MMKTHWMGRARSKRAEALLLGLVALAIVMGTRAFTAPPPNNVRVELLGATSSVENSGNAVTYTFTRAGSTASALPVTFRVAGTATAGTDYVLTGQDSFTGPLGVVTIPSGQLTVTLTVTPTGDTVVESNETAIISVETNASYTTGSPASATATITNDDFNDVSVTVGSAIAEDGTDNLIYTFTRTGDLVGGITVNFTVSGTALFYDDYYPADANTFGETSGTIKLLPGVASNTVTIIPIADETIEDDDTVILNVATGSGYHATAPTSATGTITNDDHNTISVSVDPASETESNGDTHTYTFTRTGDLTNELIVNYTVAGSATEAVDYNFVTPPGAPGVPGGNYGPLPATTVTFAASSSTATKSFEVVNDGLAEEDETIVIAIGADTDTSNKAYQAAASPDNEATHTITNDDGTGQGPDGPGGPGGGPYTLTVNSTDDHDDGSCSTTDCTLREAINHSGSGDTIDFDYCLSGDKITLDEGQLCVDHSVTIDGPSSIITVDGNNSSRVFKVKDCITVAFNNLKVTCGSDSQGGGIKNAGTLTLENCALTKNSATDGGAIYNSGTGTLNLRNSQVSSNDASCNGGAIHSSGAVSIFNSTIAKNCAKNGGAIYAAGGTVTSVNATIAGNTAVNSAPTSPPVPGGAYTSPTAGGGGIFNDTATVTLNNTLVVGNKASQGADLFGAFDGSHSLIGDASGFTGIVDCVSGNQVDVDWTTVVENDCGKPVLDDNGGDTKTIKLLAYSPALHAGDQCLLPNDVNDADDDCNTSEPYPFDQRGCDYDRIQGSNVDIGAYEAQPEDKSLVVTTSVDIVDQFDYYTSLREAVDYANSGCAGRCPHITFDTCAISFPTGFSMSGGQLCLSHDMKITGPAFDTVHINGSPGRFIKIEDCAEVELKNLDFHGNGGVGDGGGHIFVESGSALKVSACEFNGGGGHSQGGHIFNNGGCVLIDECDMNSGNAMAGGGSVYNNGGYVSVENSAIIGSTASFVGGGALFNNGGQLNVANSTLQGNSGNGGQGGAIYNNMGQLRLTNVTISGNNASKFGGVYSNNGCDQMVNTVIACNTGTGGDINFSDHSCYNFIGGNPKLNAPALNGGLTKTMSLQADSPLINAGDDEVLCDYEFDQRGCGYPRKHGFHVDIGAFEDQNNRAPVANNQSVYAYKNVAQTICLDGVDGEGDALTFYLVSRPMAGVRLYNGPSTSSPLIGSGATLPFKLASNKITYAPTVNFTGCDSFTWKVKDDSLFSTTATASVNVVNPVPPALAITSPTNNQDFKDTVLSEVNGTVQDNTPDHAGISSVKVYLYRAASPSGYAYWNGTDFTTYANFAAAVTGGAARTTCIIGDTTSGATWKTLGGELPSTLMSSGTYFIRADALDNRNVLTTVYRTIKVRTGPPTVAITSVTNNGTYNSLTLPSISGTVTDNSPNTAGITSVTVSLYRKKIGGGYEYWNGSAWGASGNVATSLSAPNWSVTNAPTSSQNSSQYYVKAFATDGNGAVGDATVASFKLVNGAPTVAFTTPTNNQTGSSIPSVTGTVTDNSPNAVGIQKIVLILTRPKSGGGTEYWTNGGSWVAYASSTAALAGDASLTCSLSVGGWSCTATLPTGSDFNAGSYSLRANALDNTGTSSANVFRTFISNRVPGSPGTGSTSGLSTASASASGDSATLTFSSSLNADSAGDAGNYTVTVNGQSVAVVGVSYSSGRVVLTLDGDVKVGDQVQIAWSVQSAASLSLSGSTSATAK